MSLFELKEGIGHKGGLVIEIGEGPQVAGAQTPCLYVRDEAFSFIEPSLSRHAANYAPGARYGVTEIAAEAWKAVVKDLRALAARLTAWASLSDMDIAWVHTVDLDNDVEIDSATFRQRFDDPGQRDALRVFLVSVADWIEESLTRQTVLTVYGV